MTLLALLYGIAAAWWFLLAFLSFDVTVGMRELQLAGYVLGIVNVAVAMGLFAFEKWSWTGALVLAVFNLFGFPFGTTVGIVGLVLLREPEIRAALGRRIRPPDAPVIPPPFLHFAGSGLPLQHPGHGAVSQPVVHDTARVQSMPAVVRCGNCGAPLQPENAFCGKCGAATP